MGPEEKHEPPDGPQEERFGGIPKSTLEEIFGRLVKNEAIERGAAAKGEEISIELRIRMIQYGSTPVDELRRQSEQYLKDFPDQSGAYQMLALALGAERDYSAAIQTMQEAVGRFPDNAELLDQLAHWHRVVGYWTRDGSELEQAAAIWDRIFESDRTMMAGFQAGLMMADLGRLREAQQRFKAAVNVDPSHGFSHFYLACTERDTGNLGAAFGSFMTAGGLFVGVNRLHQAETAVEAYQQALLINPRSEEAQAGLLRAVSHLSEMR